MWDWTEFAFVDVDGVLMKFDVRVRVRRRWRILLVVCGHICEQFGTMDESRKRRSVNYELDGGYIVVAVEVEGAHISEDTEMWQKEQRKPNRLKYTISKFNSAVNDNKSIISAVHYFCYHLETKEVPPAHKKLIRKKSPASIRLDSDGVHHFCGRPVVHIIKDR